MVENFELMGLVQVFFKAVNRALVNSDGNTALQTGEVMAVFLGQAVEGLARG
jgi:hypothetical protein